jgi:uncharacterized protein (UPF0212 family)
MPEGDAGATTTCKENHQLRTFRERPNLDREVGAKKCPHCSNKFKGNNDEHTEKIIDDHINRVHKDADGNLIVHT